MARYKEIDTSPRFLAVDLSRQLLPGTFEHARNELLEHDIEPPRGYEREDDHSEYREYSHIAPPARCRAAIYSVSAK